MDDSIKTVSCKKCGNELEQDDLFCSKCGAPVQAYEEEAVQPLCCSNCGKELKPDSQFCPKCGTPVEVVIEDDEIEDPIYCVKCGKALAPELLFCSNCGTPTIETMETIKDTDVSPNKKDKKAGLFVFVLSVISVLLILSFPLFGMMLVSATRNIDTYFIPAFPIAIVMIITLIKTILALVNKEFNWMTITASVLVVVSIIMYWNEVIYVDRYKLNRDLRSVINYRQEYDYRQEEIDDHNRQVQEAIERINRGY